MTWDMTSDINTLEISKATEDDEGEYSVVAKNDNGATSVVFSVTVHTQEQKKKPKKKQVKVSGDVDVSEEKAGAKVTMVTGEVAEAETEEAESNLAIEVTMETAVEVTDVAKKGPKVDKAAIDQENVDVEEVSETDQEEPNEEFTLMVESTVETMESADTDMVVHQTSTMQEENVSVESVQEAKEEKAKKPKKEKTVQSEMDTVETMSEVSFEEPIMEKSVTKKTKSVTVVSSEEGTTFSEIVEENVTESVEKTLEAGEQITIETETFTLETSTKPLELSDTVEVVDISEEVVNELTAADEELRGRGPHFDISPQPMVVNQGDTIRVTCKITGWIR